MQVQKVNSNQNFNGGLVKITPTRFIDVDAIEGLHLQAGDIFLKIVGRPDRIDLGNFGQRTQEVFANASKKLERARKMLTGSTNRTLEVEPKDTINVDSIEGLLLDDDSIYIDIKGVDSCYEQSARESFFPKELPTEFEYLASFVHLLKSPNGGDIFDLFG